jgi:hypothetical protein
MAPVLTDHDPPRSPWSGCGIGIGTGIGSIANEAPCERCPSYRTVAAAVMGAVPWRRERVLLYETHRLRSAPTACQRSDSRRSVAGRHHYSPWSHARGTNRGSHAPTAASPTDFCTIPPKRSISPRNCRVILPQHPAHVLGIGLVSVAVKPTRSQNRIDAAFRSSHAEDAISGARRHAKAKVMATTTSVRRARYAVRKTRCFSMGTPLARRKRRAPLRTGTRSAWRRPRGRTREPAAAAAIRRVIHRPHRPRLAHPPSGPGPSHAGASDQLTRSERRGRRCR